ncbi:hemicentin-2 [Plakobranchus ocellatus]|uniref:Hemicentin-2 n=1 Tax=Plakobranchus ocellatus TaxID=259542 RepID=A0AAV4D1Q0_9GAST|nr:hemicentin-2 [Plakobranchus ocellatus]
MAEVRCFDCPGVSSPHDCATIKRCRADEQCYTRAYVNDAYAIMYDLGCQSNGFCSVVPKRSFSQDKELLDITYVQLALAKNAKNTSVLDTLSTFSHGEAMQLGFPKDNRELPYHVQKRQYEIPLCTKCCNKDHCNSDLCPSSLITKPPGLRCYDCGFTLVNDPVLCYNVRICGVGESCHVAQKNSLTGIKYQVNCDSSARCADTGSSTPYGKRDIVDSEIENDDTKISKRAATRCYTCCDSDFCNIDYCSRYRPLPGNTSSVTMATPTATTTTSVGTTTGPRCTWICQGGVSLLFVQFPSDVERELNTAPVRYICQVDGLPAPVYRWVRAPGTDVTSKATLSADGKTSTLTFDPVTPADEGEYTCFASNGFETIDRTGKLTVWAPLAKTGADLSQKTEVEEGKDVNLNCQHTGYPDPNYRWEVTLNNGVNLTSNLSVYTLTNISRYDSGTYECYIDNAKENKTLTTRVDVQYAPEFTTQLPVSINVTEGQNFTFQCPAEGNPPPEWSFMYFDENSFPHILSNVFTTANSDALFISKMLDTYSGTYTCYIRNSVGTKSQTLTVKVVPIP